MEKEIKLTLTENEILAIVFALSGTREDSFRGCTPTINYNRLSDKIGEQLFSN